MLLGKFKSHQEAIYVYFFFFLAVAYFVCLLFYLLPFSLLESNQAKGSSKGLPRNQNPFS